MFEKYAFENSSLAQLIFNPNKDEIISLNDAAASLFWNNKEQLVGQGLSHYFQDQWYNLISFTQATIEQGNFWTTDLSISSPDKQQARDLDLHACAIQLEENSETYIHLYLQDIIEIDEKRALSHANRQFFSGLTHWQQVALFFEDIERDNHLLLNAVGEGIYGVDTKGRTTFINPVAEELLNWTADELIGKEIHQIIHHSHENGSCYEKHHCPIYAAFQDGAIHRQVDEVFWRKDGTPIPVEYTSTPLRDRGQLVGAVVVFRDISVQKKAKESLVAALEEVRQLKQKLEHENAYLQEELLANYNHHQIVGNSNEIKQVLKQIELVGPTDASVLITGESGTGKELVARAIHEASNRSKRPMIRVNCAAIPRDIFESEFFGHIKGAFTGAANHRIGRFELANGGTIFLDEIGEMPFDLQSKLLRVLQEQQIEKVGDTKTTDIDVRVIAATNQNLSEQITKKEFREDLYFRLNVFPIELPALRDRKDDIKLLAMNFLEKVRRNFNRPELKINMPQLHKLEAYHWPGNVRELKSVIERQAIVARENHLVFNSLNDSVEILTPTATPNTSNLLTEDQYIDIDKQRINAALKLTKGKVFGAESASELLGVKPTTLASRIKKYKFDIREYK